MKTSLSDAAFEDVTCELWKAMNKFPPMHSAHEGYSILAEEVDELWEEVRGKQGSRDVERMRQEAIQVAAMAIRFIVDVCDGGRGNV